MMTNHLGTYQKRGRLMSNPVSWLLFVIAIVVEIHRNHVVTAFSTTTTVISPIQQKYVIYKATRFVRNSDRVISPFTQSISRMNKQYDSSLSATSSSSSSMEEEEPDSKEEQRHMSPLLQLVVLLGAYVIHLTVLTQHNVIFPFQLFPNDHGRYQSIGWDSIAGIVSIIVYKILQKRNNNLNLPPLLSSPSYRNKKKGIAPWNFAVSKNKKKKPMNKNNTVQKVLSSPRLTSSVALFLLVVSYFLTGYIASFMELSLYALAAVCPMTIAMHRSLVVLLGHLAWVVIGSLLLRIILRPQPFFGGKGKWYTNQIRNKTWVWWTMGGYFISSWLFNIADFLNQIVLPKEVFDTAAEGVVSQLINPENNDFLASLVGYIAPCMSAPWWEEVLYRGFILPALTLQLKFWPAVFVSGLIFSLHHVSATGAIPLAFLGWIWAIIYAKSGNLLVTILIHAMWNSRVFLGSWLGL